MIKLFIIFIGLSIVNVILNTIKQIVTVKGGKLIASLVNGITFFVYTYVIIYTNCELNMHIKAIATGIINIIGVYIVKLIEEKTQKIKLWKIEFTVKNEYNEKLNTLLQAIPHNKITVNDNKHTVYNCYCNNKQQANDVKNAVKLFNAKYFISEAKGEF